jgi:DNA-binding phage protein
MSEGKESLFEIDPKVFEPFKAFYNNAEARDEAFIANVLPLMKAKGEKSALLISGGFHTEGLIQRLKEKGISYVLIMPSIAKIPESSPYVEQMHGNVSWKSYFQVENGKISLYKAFVRAVRDRLIEKVEGGRMKVEGAASSGQLLKNWRDQIIRDLANSKSVAKAQNYTQLLDEVLQKKDSDLLNQWYAKIDRFIDGLKKLEEGGNLNKQGLQQLLKMSTIPAAVDAPATLVASGRDEIRAEVDGEMMVQGLMPEAPAVEVVARPEAREASSAVTAAREKAFRDACYKESFKLGSLRGLSIAEGLEVADFLESIIYVKEPGQLDRDHLEPGKLNFDLYNHHEF